MSNLRRIIVKRAGVWSDIKMMELAKGDLFRMLEGHGEGTPKTEQVGGEWRATSEPYRNKQDVATIEAHPEPPVGTSVLEERA